MLAAAARMARGVDVPVTVDAEAGYGLEPADLVAALRSAGAAGFNLEDTDHAAGRLRDPDEHAEWLAAGLGGAAGGGDPARVNTPGGGFLRPVLPRGRGGGPGEVRAVGGGGGGT